jgi:hypothetical protein
MAAGEVLLTNAWKASASDPTVLIHPREQRAELIATAHAHFAAAQAYVLMAQANEK